MERESFIFYRSFFEALQDLKDKDRLKVYDAICESALNENDNIKLSGIAKTVFTLVKPQLEANTKKYKDGCKGGRPKKTTGYEKEKTTGYFQKKPNENENVNVNENVNAVVNDSRVDGLPKTALVNDSCVDGLQEIIEFYENNIGFIAPFVLETLSSYAQKMGKDLVILAMQKAVEANVRTVQYIRGILNNWENRGIKSVVDAKNENERFKKQNMQLSQQESEEDYTKRRMRELGWSND